MIIEVITDSNRHYVESFIKMPKSEHFRYFNTRDITVLDNHIVTLIGLSGEEIIGYAHIDFEDKYWLGICIVDHHIGKGYGSSLMKKLLEIANNKGLEQLDLSVDADNYNAIHLYKKFGFEMYKESTNVLYFSKFLRN